MLDEAETIQRMRADTREKGLNALRQLLDELDAGRYPGLYLVVTGTSAFFDGPQGVQRLPPLAQRLHTDFATDARFDNPRAVQIRLPGFDLGSLASAGGRVRDLFADQAAEPARIRSVVDDAYLADLANGVAGRLGGKAGGRATALPSQACCRGSRSGRSIFGLRSSPSLRTNARMQQK